MIQVGDDGNRGGVICGELPSPGHDAGERCLELHAGRVGNCFSGHVGKDGLFDAVDDFHGLPVREQETDPGARVCFLPRHIENEVRDLVAVEDIG